MRVVVLNPPAVTDTVTVGVLIPIKTPLHRGKVINTMSNRCGDIFMTRNMLLSLSE